MLAAATIAMPSAAEEAAWPSRPIKAIVPFPAGSAADTTGRIVMTRLAKRLGQPIVIENRPGAGGTLGSDVVAHSKPDGYTLLIHSSSHTITGVYGKLNYDPATDLVGVAPLSFTQTVFVVAASKGYHSLNDLVTAAKAHPGKINYASAGVGTVTQLGAEALRSAGDFQATHVPFKGTGEAMSDLLAGRVDYFLAPVSMVIPYIKNGQLVPLATVDSKRSNLLPDVPTTAESGYPSVSFPIWMGLFAPAKTPRNVIEKLNAEVNEVLKEPETRKQIESSGSTATTMGVDEFASFLAEEFKRNTALVKAAGIKQD
jgi:tripartite-type tricarboxylate transporter receptor subunit TctC